MTTSNAFRILGYSVNCADVFAVQLVKAFLLGLVRCRPLQKKTPELDDFQRLNETYSVVCDGTISFNKTANSDSFFARCTHYQCSDYNCRSASKGNHMTLSAEEIQQPRCPGELVAFVEAVRARATVDDELRSAGHLRRGYLKEFFDEIVPLSHFAVRVYPPDYTVCPILGNQGYDAEVRDSHGKLVDRVEIANPIDGQAVAIAGRQLANFGITDLQVGDPGDDLEAVMLILRRTIKKKAMKDYSDATVVFKVSAYAAFQGFEDRHADQIDRIRGALSAAGFRAKRVFAMLPSGAVVRVDA